MNSLPNFVSYLLKPYNRFSLAKLFGLFIFSSIFLFSVSYGLAQSTTTGSFTLTFEGVNYNITDSTSTWCYTLVWNGTAPTLSHLTIQLGKCAEVLSAYPENFKLGLDGSTDIFGIKWDTTIPPFIPVQFCFTLDGLYITEPVLFAAKAGSYLNIAHIPGPSLTCQACQLHVSCAADVIVDCNKILDSLSLPSPQIQGNCPPFNISYSDQEIPGVCPQQKIIQRSWRVSDATGFTDSCQQTITVQDTVAPILGCAPRKTIFHPDTVVFDSPQVQDNCDSNPLITIVSTTASGPDCPYESVYTRTWQAVDACGNLSAQCSQTVVYQNRAPELTLSDDKTVVKNETLVVSVSSFDPDGTIPILTVFNLPPNSDFIDNLDGTGQVIFTPDDSQVGVHPHLTFIASDGCLADTEIISLHVFVRQDSLAVNVHSPVNLVVIDPKLDSIGIDFNTILEGSSYDTTRDVNNDGEKDDIVKIPNPYLGLYQIRVVPEDTGLFSAGIRIDGNDEVNLASNVVIPNTDTTFEYQAEIFKTLRGDVNEDAKINLADIIFLVNYTFRAGPASDPLALSNMNCDKKEDGTDKVNLQDIIYIVNYIFKGGSPPCS